MLLTDRMDMASLSLHLQSEAQGIIFIAVLKSKGLTLIRELQALATKAVRSRTTQSFSKVTKMDTNRLPCALCSPGPHLQSNLI